MFVSLSYAETNCTSQGAEDEGYNSFSLTTTTTTTTTTSDISTAASTVATV